jgi:hypothetical protein
MSSPVGHVHAVWFLLLPLCCKATCLLTRSTAGVLACSLDMFVLLTLTSYFFRCRLCLLVWLFSDKGSPPVETHQLYLMWEACRAAMANGDWNLAVLECGAADTHGSARNALHGLHWTQVAVCQTPQSHCDNLLSSTDIYRTVFAVVELHCMFTAPLPTRTP